MMTNLRKRLTASTRAFFTRVTQGIFMDASNWLAQMT
jgi:hypothetical protein